jgi:hypothetical protein
MARKKSPAEPTKSRSSSPAARSRALRVTLVAHPRLVHGFLVRVVPNMQAASAIARPAGAAITGVKTRPVRLPTLRHEGPTDDTTFH